jgi:nucleoside-diphosphate-sugar epimerase
MVGDERSFGNIYNVGTGVKTTVEELLAKMMELAGIKKPVVVETGTPGDQKGIYADVTLAKSDLGFKNKYRLEEGLSDMINWAKGFEW